MTLDITPLATSLKGVTRILICGGLGSGVGSFVEGRTSVGGASIGRVDRRWVEGGWCWSLGKKFIFS